MTPSRLTHTSRLAVEPLEDRATPAGGLLDPTFGAGGIVTSTTVVDTQFGGLAPRAR